MTTTRQRTSTKHGTAGRLATAVALSLILAAGAASAAEMGGHGGGMSMGHGGFTHGGGGGFAHGVPPGGVGMRGGGARGGGDWRFADHGFHDRRFRDGVVIVPFGFGYYAPYAGYYPYPPTPYETYCNQLSPYYDPQACWNYYGG